MGVEVSDCCHQALNFDMANDSDDPEHEMNKLAKKMYYNDHEIDIDENNNNQESLSLSNTDEYSEISTDYDSTQDQQSSGHQKNKLTRNHLKVTGTIDITIPPSNEQQLTKPVGKHRSSHNRDRNSRRAHHSRERSHSTSILTSKPKNKTRSRSKSSSSPKPRGRKKKRSKKTRKNKKTHEIDPLSLIQSVEDDIYKPSIPTTSTNDCPMYNLNKPGENSQNGTIQISMQISDHQQQTLTHSEDEHETNEKDEGEKEDIDLDNITKPNLFREDTKANWDSSDIEDLEYDMKLELQSINFHIVVGDQVSTNLCFCRSAAFNLVEHMHLSSLSNSVLRHRSSFIDYNYTILKKSKL